MSNILGALFPSDAAFAPFLSLVSDAGITFPSLALSYSDISDPHITFDLEADFNLPAPFQASDGGSGTTAVTLHFTKNVSAGGAYELSGSFATSLLLPGQTLPVGIAATASVVKSGSAVEVSLSGSTTAPFSIPSLPCLQFGAMSLSATFSVGEGESTIHNSHYAHCVNNGINLSEDNIAHLMTHFTYCPLS